MKLNRLLVFERLAAKRRLLAAQDLEAGLQTTLYTVQTTLQQLRSENLPRVVTPYSDGVNTDPCRSIAFVSDASGGYPTGLGVYSLNLSACTFQVPQLPYIFVQQLSAQQWGEMKRNTVLLEARAVSLALEHLQFDLHIRSHVKGAHVYWVSDCEQLINRLKAGPGAFSGKSPAIANECQRIFRAVSSLQLQMQWHWLSRDHSAIKLAHGLAQVAAREANGKQAAVTALTNQLRNAAAADLKLLLGIA